MEVQTTSGQVDLTQKKNMAKFVHDVADMEVRVFTLREAAKRIRIDSDQSEHELCRKIAMSKKECENKEKAVELAKKEYKKCSSFAKYAIKHIWPCLGVLLFIALALVLPLGGICGTLAGEPSPISQICFFSSLIALWIIGLTVIFILLVKWYKDEKKEANQKIDTTQAEYEQQILMIQNYEKDLRTLQKETKVLALNRAKELDDTATEVESCIRKCYSMDVIKPSYQKLVCVVILDEVFQNDKADTMREANLLCDIEIRHSELIGKLDDVINALHVIANNLDRINDVLSNIDRNVAVIREDVKDTKDTTRQIAYAAESAAISSAATATWCAMHW